MLCEGVGREKDPSLTYFSSYFPFRLSHSDFRFRIREAVT